MAWGRTVLSGLVMVRLFFFFSFPSLSSCSFLHSLHPFPTLSFFSSSPQPNPVVHLFHANPTLEKAKPKSPSASPPALPLANTSFVWSTSLCIPRAASVALSCTLRALSSTSPGARERSTPAASWSPSLVPTRRPTPAFCSSFIGLFLLATSTRARRLLLARRKEGSRKNWDNGEMAGG